MYTPNNINFRIVSSNALSQFKSDQAFDFNELVNNQSIVDFCVESREVLLLNYEIWFRFILKIEKMFIAHDEKATLDSSNAAFIHSMAKDAIENIEQIMVSNPQFFGIKTREILKSANSLYHKQVFASIGEVEGETIYMSFPRIVSAISTTLHNLLLMLQECEYLLNSDTMSRAFISYSPTVLDNKQNVPSAQDILVEKAKSYKSAFGVDSFEVKSYHGAIDDSVLNLMKQHGFNVKRVTEIHQ